MYMISLIFGIVLGIPFTLYLLYAFILGSSLEISYGPLSVAFTARAVVAAIGFILLFWLWRSSVPFGPFDYWFLKGNFGSILGTAWPIFLWGGLAFLLVTITTTRLIYMLTHRLHGQARFTPGLPTEGMWQSIWIGIGEEIIFRWLVFYDVIVLLGGLNFLLGGWMGDGLLAWLYLHLVGPVVDSITFAHLHGILFHPGWTWTIGAAIIIVSFGRFKHRFFPITGNLSWLVFWPVELFLFLVMFTSGIFASMLVHVVYEAFLVVLVLSIAHFAPSQPADDPLRRHE